MRHGFSLVELSIILVIVGLLAGGVIGGKSLIRATKLRSVPTDVSRYQLAINNFEDKYNALPGDMPNAVKYWGAAAGATTDGVDATCRALAVAATQPLTCNGDGDGYFTGTGGSQPHEQYRAWQQLANAGFIGGNYDGYATGTSAGTPVAGTNVPESKIAQAAFGLRAYAAVPDANTTYFAGDYGNTMLFGVPQVNTGSMRGGIITPTDAWKIDDKVDDGSPATGKWVVPELLTTCHTNTGQTSGYALTTGSIACAFMIKMGSSGSH